MTATTYSGVLRPQPNPRRLTRHLPTWPGLPGKLAERARWTGSGTALRFGALVLTFRDWEILANRLAHRLIARGVRPGDRVALLLHRGPSVPVAMMAVLKAGAAVVPLDPTSPSGRIGQALAAAQPALVLTQGESPVPLDGRVIDLNADSPAIRAMPTGAPKVAVHPEDPAWVRLTPGPDGRSAATAVSHQEVEHFLDAMAARPGLGRGDVLVAVTAPPSGPAVLELLHPLVSGGQTVLADRGSVRDGERLRGLLARTGATVVHGTAATWRLLDGAPELAGVTALACGGSLTRDAAGGLLRSCRAVYEAAGTSPAPDWRPLG